MMYPITEEALETVVKAYGEVVQRVIYERSGVWQVRRQFWCVFKDVSRRVLRPLCSMLQQPARILLNKHWRAMPSTREVTIRYRR